MATKKRLFDLLFIILSGAFLAGLEHYGLLEEYAKFAVVPMVGAYFLGQYAERKFEVKKEDDNL